MIMEIKMNNSLTFDEVADKLGCSVEDLQKIAFKKILFSFGSMESLRNFVPSSQMTISFVTLSKRLSCSYHTCFFFMPLLDIGGCLYVRL